MILKKEQTMENKKQEEVLVIDGIEVNDEMTKGQIIMLIGAFNVRINELQKKINSQDNALANARKYIKNIEYRLKTFINKQTAEIRVFSPDEKKWEDYTGVFYVDSNNDEELIINKAIDHYNEYFGNMPFYRERTLGLFITGPEGKKLVKVLQDEENNIAMGDKN
tara:strand:+ start:2850 stop:3344 length:495 start_codon:yes stop_codon:yes gene_type:complete